MEERWMRGHLPSLCVIVQWFIIDQIGDRNAICINFPQRRREVTYGDTGILVLVNTFAELAGL